MTAADARENRPRLLSTLVEKLFIPILLAAVPPFTTWIYTRGTKEREITLAEVEQQYRALDRAVAADAKKPERQLVLTFLTRVSADARIQAWAASELQRVTEELEPVRAENAELKRQLDTKSANAKTLKDQLAKALAEKGAGDSSVVALTKRVLAAEDARRIAASELARYQLEADLVPGRFIFDPIESCAHISGLGQNEATTPPECRPIVDRNAQAYIEEGEVAQWTVTVGDQVLRCLCVLRKRSGSEP